MLEPPRTEKLTFKKGDILTFELILFGRGIDYLPHFINVFESIGKNKGLGARRRGGYGRFEIVRIEDVLNDGKTIYEDVHKVLLRYPRIGSGKEVANAISKSLPNFVDLTFVTPTRLKSNGRYIWLHDKNKFPADGFLKNIHRRLYNLIALYCKESLKVEDYEEPKKIIGIEAIPISLKWDDLNRYSSRQEKFEKYGGVVGKLRLAGNIAPWINLIKLGEIFHAGSRTSFGLGKYEITTGNEISKTAMKNRSERPLIFELI